MTTGDPDEMIWEKLWVGHPVGTHYSEGTSSVLVFDDETNGLRTHATRGDIVEEDDESEGSPGLLTSAVVIAAAFALGIGAAKAAPRARTWWRNRVAKRRERAANRDADGEAPAVALQAITVEDFSQAVDVALGEHRTMSSAQAERNILEIVLAAAIIARNLRALSGARIEDGASPELQAAMEKLTAPHLTDRLNHMLEADSSVLDDETSPAFVEIFGDGQTADGRYVPLRNEKVEEALRLR